MVITDVSRDWTLTLSQHHTAQATTSPRSLGIHVSDLVRLAAIDHGLFDADDNTAYIPAGESFPQPAINRMCGGLAWEEWLEKRYKGVLAFHPGEVSRDGVSGSPDAVHMCQWSNRPVVHEFKFTWKSVNTGWKKNWYWLSQIQAYLHCLSWDGAGVENTPTVGYLHTYHVNGDYKGSGPIYRVMQLSFTHRELTDNWDLLSRYRPQAQAQVEAKLQLGIEQ